MKEALYKDSFAKISEEKRNKILQSAITEFAEHGFESANINVIAKKSGISIGAMYSYFSSKEDLFATTVHHAVEALKSVLDGITQEDDDLLSKIEKIIKAIQVNSRTNVLLTKLYSQMTAENRTDLIFRIVSEVESVSANLYTALIEKAKSEKLVRDDMDARLFAFFLDNLFISLQFSYSCEYYKERLKIFAGEGILQQDDFVARQLLKFIQGAFSMNTNS